MKIYVLKIDAWDAAIPRTWMVEIRKSEEKEFTPADGSAISMTKGDLIRGQGEAAGELLKRMLDQGFVDEVDTE